MSVSSDFTKEIVQLIEQFAKRISTKYSNISVEDIMNLWNGKEETKISKTSSASCKYKFTKGKNEGEFCTVKPAKGNEYCSVHLKHADKPSKEKKVLPALKNSKKASTDTTISSASAKSAVQTVLRTHKDLKMLHHPDTGFVFNSVEKQEVNGKIVDNKFRPLVKDDIDECRKYRFVIDKNMLKKLEDDENAEKTMIVKTLGLEDEDEEEENEVEIDDD